ncbi:MAG: glycerol-3-phosphate 1-O-acyltransferase PlsY [Alphaproteobacteria bacterium]
MEPVLQHAFVAALAYLLGSVPFGLLLTKMAGLGDIRSVGSGNIGATNVLRTGKKGLAAATLILDGGKGAAAVLLAQAYAPDSYLVAGGAAFLGHLYPVWLGFKGGKGVATFLGVTLAVHFILGLICCAVWLATAAIFRMSSLAALVAVAAAPIYAAIMLTQAHLLLFVFLALLVFIRHAANIGRLMRGEEPKIGAK